MRLKGSCHCRRVTFLVTSTTYVPFMQCYCGICRKTGGGGGYAINLGADAQTLEVQGREHISVYHARMEEEGQVTQSPAERHFCSKCGSALWLFDPRWPELLHPVASAIDTPLPRADEIVRIMLDSRAAWVNLPEHEAQPPVTYRDFGVYPAESLADWHRRHGIV